MHYNYDLNHYWKHRGHVTFGLGMKNPDNNLFYKLIPKNASSMIRHVLSQMNWQYELFDEHPIQKGMKIIVILRDPLERWISGITEYLTLYHKNLNHLNNDLLSIICSHVTFDDHTEKQIYFVNGLSTSDCVFFNFNNNLGNNLSNFFITKNTSNMFSNDLVVYASANSNKHMNIKTQIKNYLNENPKYIDIIKNHYSQDYDLFNSVNFYGNT